MNKGLRFAVEKAKEKLNEAACAVQNIDGHFTFCRFNRQTPQITVCSGGEIILEYCGSEMTIDEAIARMESVGYITPDDFL